MLTVDSGDSVTLECVSGAPDVMSPPKSGLRIPPALAAIHAANLPRPGGGVHILTGPIAVRGAEPGDTLEVHVARIELGADWGFCGHRPLAGNPARRVPAPLPQPRDEAYQFCSLAVDSRVTQTVNGEKGIHGLLRKGLLF